MMRGTRVFDLLPFFTMLAVLAVLSSSTVAMASIFSFPDLFSKFSFGDGAAGGQPGTTTTVQKALMPLNDLSLRSGISMPFGGFSPFYAPYTAHRSYKQTVMTPEGPRTQMVDQTFDGPTGERITTVTNL